jgi:hypothetical protein
MLRQILYENSDNVFNEIHFSSKKIFLFLKNSDIKKNGSMEKNVTMYSAMSMRNVDHCDFWSKKLLIIFQHN